MIASEFAQLHNERSTTPTGLTGIYTDIEAEHVQYGDTVLSYLNDQASATDVLDASVRFHKTSQPLSRTLALHQTPQFLVNQEIDSLAAKKSTAAGSIRLSTLGVPALLDQIMPERQRANFGTLTHLSRLSLATAGIQDMALRHRLLTSRDPAHSTGVFLFFSDSYNTYRRLSTGFGNEIDLALAALAVCSRNPGLCYIPAPPRCERGEKFQLSLNPNIDGIFFTVRKVMGKAKADSAIGVQVKSAYATDSEQNYDEDSMIMIYGKSDLGNALLARKRPTRSDTESISWPGHFSARSLIDLDKNTSARKNMTPESVQVLDMELPTAKEFDKLYSAEYRFLRVITRIEQMLVDKGIISKRKKTNRR